MPFQPLLPFEAEEEETPRGPRLVEEIARFCRERPLDPKVLVVPSLAIGYTLAERLVREGQAWVNLRVETVRTLASETVAADLTREGRRVLSRAQALALTEQACREALDPDSYFGALADRPGLHRAIHLTINELRGAGLSADSLPADAFADRRKHHELSRILRLYSASLEAGRYVDGIELLRRATAALASRATQSGSPVIFLRLPGLELSALERRFLERLAAGALYDLEAGPPEAWRRAARNAQLLRAVGEENEIREVLRRVLSRGIPWDEVEILHTDDAVYPALLFELGREQDIACTFSEGIGVTYTRPGQTALAFLDWISRGFAAESLRAALAGDAIAFSTSDAAPGAGPRAAARALRDADVGWGRDRHRTCLDRLITELSRARVPSSDDDGDAPEPSRRLARSRRLEAARSARRFVERALDLAPESSQGAGDLSAISAGVRVFVTEFARVADELDATARAALETLFAEFEELVPLRLDVGEACERLRDAVSRLAIASDRPRPGSIHLASFRSGGYSGRPHTFFVGLDEGRAPGRDLEDPVLLDDERRRINLDFPEAALALGREQPKEAARALAASLARVTGSVTASYSSYDLRNLSQAGEPAASAFFLDLYRESSRKLEADFSELASALPRAVGFVPDAETALDETEWWFARVFGAGSSSGGSRAPLVRSMYPWLEEGFRAEQARESSAFTVWDGRLRTKAPELDPRAGAEPFSASRIEALARCPFAYFLRHVLAIEPVEHAAPDRTRWLSPSDEGRLLHEVFKDFFEDLTAAAEKPDAEHLDRLLAVVARRVDAWRERVAPQSDLALAQTQANIDMACRTFLRLEIEHCRRVTPRYYEVPFGTPRETARSRCAIASSEPVVLETTAGRTFSLRGSIDRVDEAPDGTFQVWDYKTGWSGKFREGLGSSGGRQLQPALYALALEALLERAGRPGRVSRSGYFFPGRRGEGRRLEIPLDRRETGQTLDTLFDLLAAGFFPHAMQENDCKFCDFESVCAGPKLAGRRSARKLEASDDPVLAAFAALHGEPQED